MQNFWGVSLCENDLLVRFTRREKSYFYILLYGTNDGGLVPPALPPGEKEGGVTGPAGRIGGNGRMLPANGGATGRSRIGGGGGANQRTSSLSGSQ